MSDRRLSRPPAASETNNSAAGILEAWIYPGFSPLKSGLQEPVSFAKIL